MHSLRSFDLPGLASLDALSTRQRRSIEMHLPLVHLTLRRQDDLVSRHRAAGQYAELFQEGSLALVEAVRSHDPSRHGNFAPFAMARIHQAVSRFVHETRSIIRVPFITQRRDRRLRRRSEKDRHRPYRSPRVVHLSARHRVVAQPVTCRFETPDEPCRESITLGEILRERLDFAADSVAGRMAGSPHLLPDGENTVEQCRRERWSIPEPDEKKPIRELARFLNCPVSRVAHYEERYRKRLGKILKKDEAFQALLRLSRRAPDGLRHRLTEREWKDFALGAKASSSPSVQAVAAQT